MATPKNKPTDENPSTDVVPTDSVEATEEPATYGTKFDKNEEVLINLISSLWGRNEIRVDEMDISDRGVTVVARFKAPQAGRPDIRRRVFIPYANIGGIFQVIPEEPVADDESAE